MKLRILTASLLLAGMPLCAAELELSLPRGEWVLQSGSTPLLQREAIGLPTEQELLQDAAFSISRGQFEEAWPTCVSARARSSRWWKPGILIASCARAWWPAASCQTCSATR